ncbi:MAG: MCE family protein [Oligoflexales bacterium]|nr:MCE family protein [Oligoflexales bacterium]
MNKLGTEFRVGMFTILGVTAIVFAIFVLSPSLFERQSYKRYYTILEDAAGIMSKTHVKTNGVNVGKVVSVDLDAKATRVTIQVKSHIGIPKGSTIEIRTVGFLGDKFLEIKRSDSTEFLEEGDIIPRDKTTIDLNEVISLVGKIAKDVKNVTGSLSNVLGGEEGEKTIREIVDNLKQMTVDGKHILQDNREDLRKIVKNVNRFSNSLNEVLDENNKEKIARILASFDDSMVQVKGAAKNINLISEKIQKGEGTIGKLVNDDKTMDEVNGALKDLRKILTPVKNLQIEVDYHGELRQDTSTQNFFNVRFHTRPDSYYLVGFTDAQREEINTTTEALPPGDDPTGRGTITRTREYIKDRKALRFNLQFAKRWYYAGLRFGLFETTGGIASDLYFLNDRLKLTFEAFDFAEKNSEIRKFAHLKAYASILFYEHLYAMAGVDDPTRYEDKWIGDEPSRKLRKNINYFLGAGVSFNDQDLKALFGVATLGTK